MPAVIRGPKADTMPIDWDRNTPIHTCEFTDLSCYIKHIKGEVITVNENAFAGEKSKYLLCRNDNHPSPSVLSQSQQTTSESYITASASAPT